MLADYKLYWDPKSNMLFIPDYDTKPIDGDTKDNFSVRRFRPFESLEKYGNEYPWFEAVLICSFGTWGLVGIGLMSVAERLRKYAKSRRKRDRVFTQDRINRKFLEFTKEHPEFANTGFDVGKVRVPKSARIRRPRAAKRAT